MFVSPSSANAQGGLGRGGVTIGVRVTSEPTGANLDQVKVELVRFPDQIVQMAFTDSSGRATLPSVEQRGYIIRASRTGFQPAQVEIEVRRGQTSYEAAVQLVPEETAVARPGRVISARQLSIPESARNEFSKGIELLNQKKEPKQSIEHFQKAIDAYPDYYEAYFLLGVAHLEVNQVNSARDELSRAIELNSKFLDPYYPLAELLMSQKEYGNAEKLLLRAMSFDPEGWRWPFELAMCAAKRSQWERAVQYGQMAYNRPNVPTKVHLLMADLYSNTGNPAKAVAELEEFEKLDPQSPYVARVRQVLPELRKRAQVASCQQTGTTKPAPPEH